MMCLGVEKLVHIVCASRTHRKNFYDISCELTQIIVKILLSNYFVSKEGTTEYFLQCANSSKPLRGYGENTHRL